MAQNETQDVIFYYNLRAKTSPSRKTNKCWKDEFAIQRITTQYKYEIEVLVVS